MAGRSPKAATENNLVYVLAQAHRIVHVRFETLLKTEGVQVEHWRVLDILSDKTGRSMGELSKAVLVNNPTLTKMLDKMVTNGLVHRTLDPGDQRRVIVYITDGGLDLLARLQVHKQSIDAKLKSALGASKANALKKLLNDLVVDL